MSNHIIDYNIPKEILNRNRNFATFVAASDLESPVYISLVWLYEQAIGYKEIDLPFEKYSSDIKVLADSPMLIWLDDTAKDAMLAELSPVWDIAQ